MNTAAELVQRTPIEKGMVKSGDSLIITVGNSESTVKVDKVLFSGTPNEKIYLTTGSFFSLKRIKEGTCWVKSATV